MTAGGVAIRHYRLPSGETLLVVAVHLPSKLWATPDDQIFVALELGHSSTIVIGDLNMNPFDDGMIQATGFHAIPSHRIATDRGWKNHKGERKVDGKYYPFFYNPMWNCFGVERGGPPGTFFRDKANIISAPTRP